MGQNVSSEDGVRFKNAINKLTKMELLDIEAAFEELSSKSGDEQVAIQKPTWLNRDKFAKMFGISDLIAEQLFETFDQDKNGLIDLKEFVTGAALCLHGSLKDKCRLLFKIFNLNGDDGVSPEEFSMVLTSCLQSAHAMLLATLKHEGILEFEEQLANQDGEAFVVSAVVEKIVKEAFDKCDTSRNGKLEIDEFIQWVYKNPSLVDNIFMMQCPKPSRNAKVDLPKLKLAEKKSLDNSDKAQRKISVFDIIASPNPIPNVKNEENSENKPTLLKMASNMSISSTAHERSSLKELFSNHSDNVESFFDAFSIEKDETFQERVLTHSISDTFLDRQSVLANQNINCDRTFKFPKHSVISDSLQSITLSQEHLIGEDNSTFSLNTADKNYIFQLDEIKGSSVQLLNNEVVPQVAEEEFESAKELNEALQHQKFNAWIPNKKTQLLLNNIQEGKQIDNSVLCFPSVLVEDLLGDPVKDLAARYLSEHDSSKRPVLTADQVEFDEKGLKSLLKTQCWRAAIDWTTKYLTFHGQGISNPIKNENPHLTPGLLQIWFVRLSQMVKLRMYSSAEAELNAFKDFESPNLYYQFYHNIYPGVRGSMIPFSFRLLHAELPQHNGRPNIALDRLYTMLYEVKAVISNLEKGLTEEGDDNKSYSKEDFQERLQIWNSRFLHVNYSIGNCFLRMKEYMLAIRLFEQVVQLKPSHKAAILSGIGRIFLQLGDLSGAYTYFHQVEELFDNDTSSANSNIVTINRGYYNLCQGNYEEAYKHFSDAAKQTEPSNLSTINNAAVCLLFLGKVKEACTLLETMVWKTPEKSLHEDVLLNLNTIYELETSRALQKKYKILDLVCKYKGDNFNVQCLKLS
ncbi:trafficking protein particle complex subunit 12 isoform X2 [Hydra vulgaris]|uniref:Trafficking protein particle complex subunit 12 isoform X2 n=1 Tax=Hydra vulgaris TaxID=6087 RepID=A0ABM4D7T5_HYDVU